MLTTTTPTIDLGRVHSGTTKDFTYNVTNNGLETINLTVKASCGCTVPKLDKSIMGPLEMQYGSGTYKAPSSKGRISKSIFVNSLTESLTINIIGDVI